MPSISVLDQKYRKSHRFVMTKGYESPLPDSSWFLLTVPIGSSH